jgi:hypothetical protein
MRTALVLILVLLTATSAAAQIPQFELKGSLSWALSEGVSFQGEEVEVPGEGTQFFNNLDLSDGLTYGLGASMYLNRQLELGFLWDYHQSEIVAKGSTSIKIDDLGIDNYHGVLIYNFGGPRDQVRPIIFGGLGATVYRSFEYTDLQGRKLSSGTNGRFSTTWGAGVKLLSKGAFGIQLDFKWTPTYIKSEPGGYWCDPWWGCYSTSSYDYANQWKFGGTLLARF